MVGVSSEAFYLAFITSAKHHDWKEILNQSTLLSRKMSCVETAEVAKHCLDRIICEHFAEDHLVYDGNMLMRIAQIWIASVMRSNELKHPVESMSDVMDIAVMDQCEVKYSNCTMGNVEQCLNLI